MNQAWYSGRIDNIKNSGLLGILSSHNDIVSIHIDGGGGGGGEN